MEGYYDEAAPYLQDYLKLIHDAAGRSDVYLRCFMNHTSDWLTPDDLVRATSLFDKAAQAVEGQPVLAERVRRERLPLDHVWLKRYNDLRLRARITGADFQGPKDPAAAVEAYIKTAKKFNVGNWRERRPFAEYEPVLRDRFQPAGPPPAPCKDLPGEAWLDYPDGTFSLARNTEWVRRVDDPSASNGKAARMPGHHREWAVQCWFSDDVKPGNPWRCFVVARCEAAATNGPAMTMGIYDSRNRRGVTHRRISVEDASGAAYHTYDLGAHDLDGGKCVWIAPPERPKDVSAVFVDRVYLIHGKKVPDKKKDETP
jgi:hypothetical protein